MRVMWVALQVLLVPLVVVSLGACVWGATGLLGLTSESSPMLWIAALAIAVIIWMENAATVQVLSGKAPLWMRALWLPGTLLAVLFTFFATIAADRDFTLEFIWPGEEVSRLSLFEVAIAAAITLAIVGSPSAIIMIEKLKNGRSRLSSERNVT